MSTVMTENHGLKVGTPALQSAGALAFGPEGILFVADYAAATVYAVQLSDDDTAGDAPVEITDLDAKIASMLGVERDQIQLRGIAVHPVSKAVYLSVNRGEGDAAVAVLIRAYGGALEEVDLSDVPFDRITIDDAPALDDERLDARVGTRPSPGSEERTFNGITLHVARIPLRMSVITDLAFIDDELIVAGASNEEFASTLRRIPFPFRSKVDSTSLEIFHVNHGKYETASPIRTFVPFDDGKSVLASYTCTPVVRFSLADLRPGTQAKGSTVAELGPMNQPLDMVAYGSGDSEYLLVSNSRHPLLRIPAGSVSEQESLTTPGEPVGVPREELSQKGVSLMANLGDDRVVFVQTDDHGALALRSYQTASL